MTDLRKDVTRRTISPHNWQRRRLVVTLKSGDSIEFREEGRRTRYTAPLSSVFNAVVKWNVDAARREKLEQRRAARKARAR